MRSPDTAKPKIAYVYSDSEFGRDGVPAGKARAEKLGLPIVEEIVTKQSGVDVTPEVAKLRRANPDIVVFQGYIGAPMPEFVRQLKEAGVTPKFMGTAWGLDRPAYGGIGELGTSLTGISMYRYGHETDSSMINNMRTYLATARPEFEIVKHETFGPLLYLMTYGDFEPFPSADTCGVSSITARSTSGAAWRFRPLTHAE